MNHAPRGDFYCIVSGVAWLYVKKKKKVVGPLVEILLFLTFLISYIFLLILSNEIILSAA